MPSLVGSEMCIRDRVKARECCRRLMTIVVPLSWPLLWPSPLPWLAPGGPSTWCIRTCLRTISSVTSSPAPSGARAMISQAANRGGKRKLSEINRDPPPLDSLKPWENRMGHHLMVTGAITWCVKCGAFTEGGTPQYLLSACLGRDHDNNGLKRQRANLLKNHHPIRGFNLGDTPKPFSK